MCIRLAQILAPQMYHKNITKQSQEHLSTTHHLTQAPWMSGVWQRGSWMAGVAWELSLPGRHDPPLAGILGHHGTLRLWRRKGMCNEGWSSCPCVLWENMRRKWIRKGMHCEGWGLNHDVLNYWNPRFLGQHNVDIFLILYSLFPLTSLLMDMLFPSFHICSPRLIPLFSTF